MTILDSDEFQEDLERVLNSPDGPDNLDWLNKNTHPAGAVTDRLPVQGETPVESITSDFRTTILKALDSAKNAPVYAAAIIFLVGMLGLGAANVVWEWLQKKIESLKG